MSALLKYVQHLIVYGSWPRKNVSSMCGAQKSIKAKLFIAILHLEYFVRYCVMKVFQLAPKYQAALFIVE